MSIKLIDERKQKIKNGIKLKSKQKVVFYRFQSDYIFSNECVYMKTFLKHLKFRLKQIK